MEQLKKLRQHLLTGVSYAIPFIACGGILLAFAIAVATSQGHMVPGKGGGPDFSYSPTLQVVAQIGETAFKLMLPVLAGYISFSIASKPGLVPGFVGGYLAGEIKAGFLGAILAGLIAGYIVEAVKKIPVSRYIRPIMPILVIPILSSLAVGVLMVKVIGIPIAHLMKAANDFLLSMNTGSSVLLALLLGAMIAFDMGGPVNKVAFFFGSALIADGNYRIMGACAAAICTPPLGLGLATLLGAKLWSDEEKEAGIAGIAMGMMGITEGAIPFAAADPARVIPCIMAGSMAASTVAMLAGVGDRAPHGGPIVLPVVDHPFAYVIAILIGTFVTALAINAWKSYSQRPVANAKGAA